MNDVFVNDILGFLVIFFFTNIVCLIFYLYLAKRQINLEQDFKHQTIIFENDIEQCKSEILYTGCKLSQIEKNIIYVEKGE